MKTNTIYAVNEDSTIGIMHDIDDDEIVNMVGSDYYPGVFRMVGDVVEYAAVDLSDGSMTWKEVTE